VIQAEVTGHVYGVTHVASTAEVGDDPTHDLPVDGV
jgi:hypothetical protein